MEIKFVKEPSLQREEINFIKEAPIGFWGTVEYVDSVTNCCDVFASNGFVYHGIPVVSNVWVTEQKEFVAGERNLPMVGSRVFVLMPTGTITGSFILCSGYARQETTQHTLYAADKNEREEKNNIVERVLLSGWNEKENYTNGDRLFTSPDGNVTIELRPTDIDSDNPKAIIIHGWGNSVIINNNGLNVTDKNNNKFNLTNSGILITDKEENIVKTEKNKITLQVKDGSNVVIGSDDVTINGNLKVSK